MNSFDQDDILLEIKRKKSASAGKPAEEPVSSAPAAESAAPSAPAAKPAAKSSSQDEEWDLLWQSVSTKQKKPVLFDYDAEGNLQQADDSAVQQILPPTPLAAETTPSTVPL